MNIRNAVQLRDSAPQFYAAEFTLTANASGTQLLILDNDSEFDLMEISGVTDQDGQLAADATPINPPENFSLLITNQSSGRQFMNIAIRRGNVCGKAFTNWTPEMRAIRFPRKTQLQIQVNNLVAATIVVQVTLKGYKVFNELPGS